MSDQERLAGYVAIWWQAVDDLTALLEETPPEQWSTPTDLPGWDVHAIAAHTAHLEGVLAGNPEETVEVGRARPRPQPDGALHRAGRGRATRPHRRRADQRDPRGRDQAAHRPAGRPAHRRVRQAGPDLRRHRLGLADPAAQPPAGPVDARAGRTPRRRPARAGSTRPPPRTPSTTSSESLGYVLAKRVGAAPGTTVRLDVDGHEPVRLRRRRARPRPAGCPRCRRSRPSSSRRTGSPSPSSPAGGGRHRTARSASSATSSSGDRLLDLLAVTP